MGYVVTGEVSDGEASKRGKTLLTALSYVMDYNASAFTKKQEFSSIVSDLKILARSLERADPKQDNAKAITSDIVSYAKYALDSANLNIDGIRQEVEKNTARESYIHEALVKEGYFEWRDRMITVATYGRDPEYSKKRVNQDSWGRVWAVDKQKIAGKFLVDFQACLPDGTPKDAFDISSFKNDNSDALTKCDVAILTFNQAYEDVARETIIKLTKLNMDRLKEKGNDTYQHAEEKGPFKERLDYENAEILASSMPYVCESSQTNQSAGKMTIELLREGGPESRMKNLTFEAQFPLMNIEDFAKTDNRLRSFIDDSFGGDIGKSKDGYKIAMNVCMSHYLKEQNQNINVNKVLSSIDREMEKGLENKNPEP